MPREADEVERPADDERDGEALERETELELARVAVELERTAELELARVAVELARVAVEFERVADELERVADEVVGLDVDVDLEVVAVDREVVVVGREVVVFERVAVDFVAVDFVVNAFDFVAEAADFEVVTAVVRDVLVGREDTVDVVPVLPVAGRAVDVFVLPAVAFCFVAVLLNDALFLFVLPAFVPDGEPPAVTRVLLLLPETRCPLRPEFLSLLKVWPRP